MRAFSVKPGEQGSGAVIEIDAPAPRADEHVVRVLEVGIDATDKEIDAAEYGVAPAGSDTLVLGHEALGVIERTCAEASDLQEGDLVVPTVRRPCPQRCVPCAHALYDFCATGDYHERGIKQSHGFLTDRFVERSEFLVRVPPELRAHAVLLEPLSIVEKVFRQSWRLQERMLWRPRRLVITGAGSIGILAAMLGRLRGLDTLLFSQGPPSGAVASIVHALDIAYVDAERQSLAQACAQFGAPDLVVEATGYSPLVWEVAQELAVNGVLCLLSVTGGDRQATIASDRLNLEMVLGNLVMFGSVSSHRLDFEAAADDLHALGERWPDALDAFIARRIPFMETRRALDEDDTGVLKLVVTVHDE